MSPSFASVGPSSHGMAGACSCAAVCGASARSAREISARGATRLRSWRPMGSSLDHVRLDRGILDPSHGWAQAETPPSRAHFRVTWQVAIVPAPMNHLQMEGLLFWFPAFVLSTTFHEAAHAWAAMRGGDLTA